MVRNNSYFILSGFISLTLFLLFLFLFFYMLFSSTNIKTYALKKENYVSISLELIPTPTKKINKEVIIPKEEPLVVPEEKEVDIGDLFSDVWTKDVKIEKKKPKVFDNKRLELIKKKIKTKEINKVTPVSKNTTKNEADTIADEDKRSSAGDEVNEYLAKIQAIVYKYFYPPTNSQGHTVKAVIELSAIGKVVDFRILNYSNNQELNKECDKIKSRLNGVLFPTNPNHKSSSTIVNITSDKN